MARPTPGAGFDLDLLLTGGRRVADGISPYEPSMLAGQSVGITDPVLLVPAAGRAGAGTARVRADDPGPDRADRCRRARRSRRVVAARGASQCDDPRPAGIRRLPRGAAVLVPVRGGDAVRQPGHAVPRAVRAGAARGPRADAVARRGPLGGPGTGRRVRDQAPPRRAGGVAARARRPGVATRRASHARAGDRAPAKLGDRRGRRRYRARDPCREPRSSAGWDRGRTT